MTLPPAMVEPMDGPDDEEIIEDEQQGEDTPDASGQDGGWWLTCEPKDAKKGVLQALREQQNYRNYRSAYEQVCEMYRDGIRGLSVQRLRRGADIDYVARRDFTSQAVAPSANIADQLLHRTAAVLTVDPPLPYINGNSDDPQEREASELAERILRVEGMPLNRDDAGFLADSIDLAGTYGSVFGYFCVDPRGDGLHPVKIEAYPEATTTDDALTPMGPPGVDPMTGQPTPPQLLDVTGKTPIWRYVRLDGSLTDVQAEARMDWRPRIERRLLRPSSITLLPFGTDAYTAEGCIVGELVPLSEVIAQFYDGERPDDTTCQKLVDFKPQEIDWRQFVPRVQRDLLPTQTPTRPSAQSQAKATIADYALCVILKLYIRSGSEAPLGAYIVIGGPDEPLKRDPYRWTIGDGEQARIEYPGLPLAQLTWLEDGQGDPMGIPGIQPLMAQSDIDATMVTAWLNWCWRVSNPHTFVPLETTVQDEEFKARTGAPLKLGADGTAPYFEQVPALPAPFKEYMTENQEGIKNSSGLSTTVATGEQDANINSGLQQRLASEEARTGLSNLSKNAERYITKCWDLLVQHIRPVYDTPRDLEYSGESGDVQVRSFMGVELAGSGDVQIQKGSGTMLTPSAKAELAAQELQRSVEIGDPDAMARYNDHLLSNQGTLLGIADDPTHARMARQTQAFTDLAKQMNLPPAIPEPPPMLDPMGQPVPQPPQDPVSQQAAAIWAPNPTDEVVSVAKYRHRKLVELLASKAFTAADPRIQAPAVAEFQRMSAASGNLTLAQQQQAAQQAAQAQAAAALDADIKKIDAEKTKDPLPGVPGVAPRPDAARAPVGQPAPQGLPA